MTIPDVADDQLLTIKLAPDQFSVLHVEEDDIVILTLQPETTTEEIDFLSEWWEEHYAQRSLVVLRAGEIIQTMSREDFSLLAASLGLPTAPEGPQ